MNKILENSDIHCSCDRKQKRSSRCAGTFALSGAYAFKGTDKFGTWIIQKKTSSGYYHFFLWTKEEWPQILEERKAIYHKIDSVSYLVSDFAIANEYDKVISSIELRVRMHILRSNRRFMSMIFFQSDQSLAWTRIGKDFWNPVMRLFHTELGSCFMKKEYGNWQR